MGVRVFREGNEKRQNDSVKTIERLVGLEDFTDVE